MCVGNRRSSNFALGYRRTRGEGSRHISLRRRRGLGTRSRLAGNSKVSDSTAAGYQDQCHHYHQDDYNPGEMFTFIGICFRWTIVL